MDKKILFIGGSPCSGKSSIAELISKEYGAYYFKADDFLNEFMKKAAENGAPICKKILGINAEEIWMRDAEEQCEEEFCIYEEIAPFVFDKLHRIDSEFIITEAAAYTPKVMERVKDKMYLCIIPEAEFQVAHYKKREWVPYVLAGCSDKAQAFDNWMQRDILFARQVKKECDDKNIFCLVNDGSKTIQEIFDIVKAYFGLN